MKTVIVCTTQRSGSTMVCEDMARMGIGKPNEYFLSWIGKESSDWLAELKVMQERHVVNGVFAFKIMANQIRRIDMKLATVFDPLDDGPFPHFRAAFPGAEWIHIQREDGVDQAISHFLASRSGVYHMVNGEGDFVPGASMNKAAIDEKLIDVPYDFKALIDEWHRQQSGRLLWTEFFRSTGINPLPIVYENYDVNALRSFGRLIGVELQAEKGKRNLTKMPGSRNQKIKTQFLLDVFAKL